MLRVSLFICLLLLGEGNIFGQHIYAGGVNGFASMLDSENTQKYRYNKGGLYLHNNGWTALTHDQRLKLLRVFDNMSVAIEVGFPKQGEFGFSPDKTKYHWWCDNFRDLYVNYGLQPDIVAVNLEDTVNNPTIPQPSFAQFKRHHDDLKHMSPGSLVLPILGPMNVELPIRTDPISSNLRYQQIVGLAGGVVMDSPPKVFITREQRYRDWVVDAIKYANNNGHKSVLIVSPHSSRSMFKSHTIMMLRYLAQNKAMPSVYIVENYIYGRDYINKVGKERQDHSVLGVARHLQQVINN